MAAVLELLGELRTAVERDGPVGQSRADRVSRAEKVEALWVDLVNLLGEERQREVTRFDSWLQRVEDELEAGGDVVKLVSLGMKLTERRDHLVKLDARTAIETHLEWVADIVDAEIESEQRTERIMQRRGQD